MLKDTEPVCLIIPPSSFLTDARVFPELGILKVAAVLQQEERPVDVLDLSGLANPDAVVADYMELHPRVSNFGITATTPHFPEAVRITETIKASNSEAKVILGGAHATMVGAAYQADLLNNRVGRGTLAYQQMTGLFDVSVLGDGEEAIKVALREDAPRVVDAGSRQSPLFLPRHGLKQYPFPARELIDMSSYHYKIDGLDAQSMIAQLGCPFGCGFCGGRDSDVFRIARTRSTESIMAEVDVLVKKYGKRGIMLYDDELNISNAKLTELMEALIKYQESEGEELRLRGFVKAELTNLQQLKLMYRAGFRILLSGVESGDDGILATINKHTTRETNSRWVKLCHDAGLKAKALMTIGHPGETEASVLSSLDWLITQKPDDFDIVIISQYPGSPYFDQSEPHPTQEGVWVYTQPNTHGVLYSQAVNFAQKDTHYKGVPGDYTSTVWSPELSAQRLVELRDRFEQVGRSALGLPDIVAVAAMQFEHSMGQRNLPSSLLRSSSPS